MPRKDEADSPANDNIDPDEPWKRAQLLLEAHARISKSEIHPYDHPAAALRELLTDLMHYCAAHNVGKSRGDIEYLDFEALKNDAKQEFEVQAKTMNRAVADSKPTPTRYATPDEEESIAARLRLENDPKLAKILTALEERQAHEASELAARQSREPGADPLRHEHERDAQLRKFEDERARYVRQYNKGLEMTERLQAEERQKGFEHDLSE